MFTSPTSRVTRLSAGAWLRRFTAVLAAVTGGVLAWAAAVPAASAAARARTLTRNGSYSPPGPRSPTGC